MAEKSKEKKGGEFIAFAKDFAVGGVSGGIAKTCTAPMERVKLIMQTQDANPRIRSGEVARYDGIRDCFLRIPKEQGVKAFWRGNLTNVVRYIPTQAFNFAFKDRIKNLFPKYNSDKDFGKFASVQIASGAMAGAGCLCIVYPLDYARTRLGSDVGQGSRDFKGLTECIVKTATGPKGPLALYNGFGISVLGIIPYRGVYFGLYDSMREKNPYKKDHGVKGIITRFAIAQFSAVSAGLVANPFDIIRRRLQMQSDKPQKEWVYTGAANCASTILRKEGWRAFYKGAGANAIRTLGSALVLVLYDQFQFMLGIEEEKARE
tara:strand:- start:99 stop:1055 length:957 start_codon:yes stop_codon:yes gene_type:complete